MEHVQDQDLAKLKELLRHTGEFIAYFELAETKMMEWRRDIEQQAQVQQHTVQQQFQSLRNELDALQEILTQAGLARFRIAAEKILKQSEEHIVAIQKTGTQLLDSMNTKHIDITKLLEKSLIQIEQHTEHAIGRLDTQFAQYDIQHFRRVANESCAQVERAANHAVAKSESLLRTFQWRPVVLALITTIITAFAMGLYVSNELPWEIHQHAMNEREAGKVLMKAWPILSHEEKTKILNSQTAHKA